MALDATLVAAAGVSASRAIAYGSDKNMYYIDGPFSYDTTTQFVAPRVTLASPSDVAAYIKA